MNWWGSGYITQVIYSVFASGSGADNSTAILTENDFDIYTQGDEEIDTET
jgi:hypothetical protein